TLGVATTPPVAGPPSTLQLANTPNGNQWPVVGQPIFIHGIGHMRVEAAFGNILSISNPGWPGAAADGTPIPSGTKVSPSGESIEGPQGPLAPPTEIRILTTSPVGAPAPGQETVFVTDDL